MSRNLSPMQSRTLAAMRRDRALTMFDARMVPDIETRAAMVAERVAAARRINRAIVHYLTHVCRVQA